MSKKLIEKQDWRYYLYELDEVYELSVPVASPAPGFDVFHILNESEKDLYHQQGISALESRMSDMSKNSWNYRMASWR